MVLVLCFAVQPLAYLNELMEEYNFKRVVLFVDEVDEAMTRLFDADAIKAQDKSFSQGCAGSQRDQQLIRLTSLPPVFGDGSRLYSMAVVS